MKRTSLENMNRLAPPRRLPLTAADLRQANHVVLRALAPLELDGEALEPRQRQRLACKLDAHCAVLVREVAAGLREQAALFTDVPIDSAQLEAAQRECDAALDLYYCLHGAAELLYSAYLARQAACVEDARDVVRHVIRDSQSPFRAALPHAQRLDALGMAVPLFHRRTQRANQVRRQGRDAAAPLKDGTPGADLVGEERPADARKGRR